MNEQMAEDIWKFNIWNAGKGRDFQEFFEEDMKLQNNFICFALTFLRLVHTGRERVLMSVTKVVLRLSHLNTTH